MSASYLRDLSSEEIENIRRGTSFLLAHLRTLEVDEWTDLLRDLIHDPCKTSILFNFRFPDEAQTSFVACLSVASEQVKTTLSRAAERLIGQVLCEKAPEAVVAVESILFIGSALKLPMSEPLLVMIMNSPEFSNEARLQAGAALLAQPASLSLQEAWQQVDVTKGFFLAPVLVSALSDIDPLKALKIVANLPTGVIPTLSLEYPIREVFAKLPMRLADQVSILLKDDFPYRDVIYRVAQECPVWQSLLTQRKAAAVPPFHHYVRKAADDFNVVKYRSSGYYQKPLFDTNADPPACFLAFLGNMRDAVVKVAKRLGLKNPDHFMLMRKSAAVFDSLVDDVLDLQTIQGEVAYGSRKRGARASIVAVGTLDLIGLVFWKKEDKGLIKSHLGLAPKPILSNIVAFCIDRQYTCWGQPSTVIEEEIKNILDARKDSLDWLTETSPRLIYRNLRDDREEGAKSLAVLDWLVAKAVREQNPGELVCAEAALDHAQPAGFFVPGGDPVYSEVLQDSVSRAFFLPQKHKWNREFESLMKRAGVHLFPDGPKPMTLDDSDSGSWVPEEPTEARASQPVAR
jgi:hypothetical protein